MKVLLYNEECSICYRMARYAWRLTRGRVVILGMFSQESEAYREKILSLLGGDFGKYSSMPWLVDGKSVRGGVSIVLPILVEMILAIRRPGDFVFRDPMPLNCEPVVRYGGVSRILYPIRVLARMAIQSYRSILSKRYSARL